jgi:hypothetical protein
MVSRSTCSLFGCDYTLRTANYPLEQGIEDRNLVPFRAVAHTTKFLREDLKTDHLTDEQIAQLDDQGIDPKSALNVESVSAICGMRSSETPARADAPKLVGWTSRPPCGNCAESGAVWRQTGAASCSDRLLAPG